MGHPTPKEYLVKGFTLDDERLKSGNQPNYFQKLLDRIRDIRSTEKIFYEKVKEIYATSIDYDLNAATTQKFFASMQNKLYWAVHQHTAAELIYKRARRDNSKLSNAASPAPAKQYSRANYYSEITNQASQHTIALLQTCARADGMMGYWELWDMSGE